MNQPHQTQATPQAENELIRTVLDLVRLDHSEPNANLDASLELAREEMALAARELTRAVDAAPPDQRPVGWDAK